MSKSVEAVRSPSLVHDVITVRNQRDEHGETSKLSSSDIDDLCAFLLPL